MTLINTLNNDESLANRLHELIAATIEADEAGDPIDRAHLFARHPDLADDLRSFFALHDRLRSLACVGPPDSESVAGGECETPKSLSSSLPEAQALSQAGFSASTAEVDGDGTPREAAQPNVALDFDGETVSFIDGHGRNHDNALTGPNAAASREPRRIGNHEILEEIARGGMGVVYRARQIGLNRIVALKMIRSGKITSQEHLRRFQAEAEAAARLDHPGIVPIYEIGTEDDQPFYSMPLVDGVSLQAVVRDGPLPPSAAAEIVRRMAEAMHVAHQRGVLHRDLKPSNVLLAKTGSDDGVHLDVDAAAVGRFEPKITDFGLAKQTDVEESGLTNTGQILGTPSYMPPEQASGQTEIGPAADVYSLGAVLYCLLTGRPPFQAANVLDTLAAVLNDEPVSPRRLNPAVPKDLETIALKCLEKSPGDRYDSAAELVAELRRFAEGEPIHARPTSRWERLTKWVRRHPTRAGLIAASVIAFTALVGVGVATAYSREQSRLRHVADQYLYYNRIGLAERSYQEASLSRARRLLEECPAEKRGWEWRYLDRVTHPQQMVLEGQRSVVLSIIYSPDGRFIASADNNGAVCIWDAEKGEMLNKFSFGHLGRFLVYARFSSDGQWVHVRRLKRDTQKMDLLVCPSAVFFKPGATMSTIAGSSQTIQDLPHNGFPNNVALLADGVTLLLGTGRPGPESGQILSLDRDDGSRTETGRSANPYVMALELSPNEKFLAVVSVERESLFQGIAGISTLEIREFGSDRGVLRTEARESGIGLPRFSLDGRRLAVGMGDGVIRIFSGDEFAEATELRGHTDAVVACAFSPDGARLASSSDDRTVRIWDLANPAEPIVLRGHTADVSCAAFHPFENKLASGGADNTVIIHNTDPHEHTNIVGRAEAPIAGVGFSKNGRKVVSAAEDGVVREWPTAGGESRLIGDHPEKIWDAAISSDGRWVAVGDGEWSDSERVGNVAVWDVETGRQTHLIGAVPRVVWEVESSDDGRHLLAAGGEFHFGPGEVVVFDAETGDEQFRTRTPWGVYRAALSRDGRYLASIPTTRKPKIEVWDVPANTRVIRFQIRDEEIENIATNSAVIDPENRLLLVGIKDDVVLFDLHTGKLQERMLGHTSSVLDMEFSPDGQRLATASWDGTVKIWHWSGRQEVLTLRGHRGPVTCVDFSDDGNRLVSGGSDGTVRLWDATPRSMQNTETSTSP